MRTSSSKTPHRYRVSDLLGMEAIRVRHPDLRARYKLALSGDRGEREKHWEPDFSLGAGKRCPPPRPVFPITELSAEHPAVRYLTGRGYDQQRLWEQFRCGFCVAEYPHGKNGVFYRQMPGGWRDTAQHRVMRGRRFDGCWLRSIRRRRASDSCSSRESKTNSRACIMYH
jgi:hypothetical protein